MNKSRTSVDELFALDSQIKGILNRYKIYDYSKSINEIESESGMDSGFLEHMITVFSYSKKPLVEGLKEFSIPTIVEYLCNTHTYYLEKKLPEMENLTLELCKNSETKLSEILHFFFTKFSSSLKKHIQYEETYAFPYILKLASQELPRGTANSFRVNRFIDAHNHETEDQLRDFVLHLDTTFGALKDQMAFKLFVQHMINFEKDLRIHSAIEDDILVPRALELENKLLK